MPDRTGPAWAPLTASWGRLQEAWEWGVRGGDSFEAVAGGSDQAPSDQQPDHYLRDEPMEDEQSAQPVEVQPLYLSLLAFQG